MSQSTNTGLPSDKVNVISESEPVVTSNDYPAPVITNKVKRVVDVALSRELGVKTYKNAETSDGKNEYGTAFIVVSEDPSYEHPATISIKAVKAIQASKVQQEKPFKWADGSEESGDDRVALCYVLTGDVRTFPESTDIDKLTGEPMVTPERKCGNYYPFFGYTPVPPTNVDLTQ